MKKRQSMIGSVQLLFTAIIWGVAFVAQSEGMNYVGPFTFNCVRSFLGGVVLIPCIWFLHSRKTREEKTEALDKGVLALGGTCCGVCLFLGSTLQQLGIQRTTVGKAGFLTALYIVLVPVFSLVLGKRAEPKLWLCVLIALSGLYFLCMKDDWSVGTGDFYLLAGAVCFAIHILVIDYFALRTDCVIMSCIQFFVTGILCILPMLLLEEPELPYIMDAKIPILYAGIMSCGVAYTLQIVGQKKVKPMIASLILSGESVVSVIAGWVLLGQKLSSREIVGCVLLFLAIILAQIDFSFIAKEQKS